MNRHGVDFMSEIAYNRKMDPRAKGVDLCSKGARSTTHDTEASAHRTSSLFGISTAGMHLCLIDSAYYVFTLKAIQRCLNDSAYVSYSEAINHRTRNINQHVRNPWKTKMKRC